jgi:hypothetical protein
MTSGHQRLPYPHTLDTELAPVHKRLRLKQSTLEDVDTDGGHRPEPNGEGLFSDMKSHLQNQRK